MNWPLAWQVFLGVCVLAALGAAIAALTLILTHSEPAPYKPPKVLPVARGGTGETSLDALNEKLSAMPTMIEYEGTMDPVLLIEYARGWDPLNKEPLVGVDYLTYFETKRGGVTTLSFPNVQISQWGLALSAPKLTRMDMPDMVLLNGFEVFVADALVTVSMPKLKWLEYAFIIHDAPALETIDMPVLEVVSGWVAIGTNNMRKFSWPAVRAVHSDFTVGGTTTTGFAISVPKLEELNGYVAVNVTHLQGFDVGTALRTVPAQNFVVKGTVTGLDQAAVDAILTDLAANTAFIGQTVDVGGANAAPSATAAIATLEGRGCTVTHN